MGAPTAQVQSPQTSQPAGKGAGFSPSTDRTTMTLGGLSGQPEMGAPNTNSNVDPGFGYIPNHPINPTFVAPLDGATNQNPYPNTIGMPKNPSTQTPMGKSGGAISGGGIASGKGISNAGNTNSAMGTGPNANY